MTDLLARRPSRVWGYRRIGALVLASITLAAGLTLFSTRAWAVLIAVPETGTSGLLWLESTPGTAEFQDMSPGSVEYWQISANMADQWSPLTMQFKRDGDLVSRPDGLNLQLQRCAQEWVDHPGGPQCASGAINVFGPMPASDPSFGARTANGVPLSGSAPVFSGGMITSAQSSFALVTLSIPDTPAARADETLMGLEATLGFGFTVSGDGSTLPPEVPPVTPPVSLASAGVDAIAVGLLAAGALGLGLVLRGARRTRMLHTDGKANS